MPTHEVTNQVPPLLGFNTAATPMIDDALRRAHVDATQLDAIHALGALGGTAEALEWGDLAEAHPPVLKTHDRYGNRIDEVVYDPAYHRLMTVAVEHGLHAAPWAEADPNAHLVRAAKARAALAGITAGAAATAARMDEEMAQLHRAVHGTD